MGKEISDKKEKRLVQTYFKTGLQYGHKSEEWNPKIAPYIFHEKYGFHIFHALKTAKFLALAGRILEKKAREGKQILFVGTDSACISSFPSYAKKANIFYINYRWLGGMLTNWSTLQKRIETLQELEAEQIRNNFKSSSKKIANKKRKTLNRLERLFGGIKKMKSMPDIVVFTSQVKEKLAILECQKLGIPTVCIVDSNCDFDLTPYPIPANDEAPASINLILEHLVESIKTGEDALFRNADKSTICSTFSQKSSLFKKKIL